MHNPNPIKTFKIERLRVKVYDLNGNLGKAAAEFVSGNLQSAIHRNGYANLILATGASQFTFLEALQEEGLDWSKITVFHLDEYRDISENHPASFRRYLRERILNKVKPRHIYFLEGDAVDTRAEIERYENLLNAHSIDVACIGIGENGHIAFNDPPVADFDDPKRVKVVDLDEACRRQQTGEGWFATIEDVPKQALTLTIPAIMDCKVISCVVPDQRKSDAVYKTLYGPISTACPASVLRKHAECVLFLDVDSASRFIHNAMDG